MFKPTELSLVLYRTSACKQRRRRYAATFAAGVVALAIVVGAITWIIHTYYVIPSSPSTGITSALPGINGQVICDQVKQDAGYIQLANKKDGHYFYWFFESRSRPREDPLIVWLSGGPGCSSLWSAVMENGPCTVSPQDLTTTKNPFSWNTNASVVYLDQPLLTGFSYSSNIPEDIDTSSNQVSENLYWFLQGFFRRHPQLRSRPLFLAGDGYAGQFIPVAAYLIYNKNQELQAQYNSSLHINLQGVAIGNGLTVASTQYSHYLDFARNNTHSVELLDALQLEQAKAKQRKCLDYIDECQSYAGACVDASIRCHKDIEAVLQQQQQQQQNNNNTTRNTLDIRQNCSQHASALQCYETAHIDAFFNSESTQKYLNVRPAATQVATTWTHCNRNVSLEFALAGDGMKDRQRYLGKLLDVSDLRVLIYAGDADARFNWMGIDAWTRQLQWRYKKQFAESAPMALLSKKSDGSKVTGTGIVRAYETKFAFVRVFDAGHFVALDQPQVALTMLNRFMWNQSLS